MTQIKIVIIFLPVNHKKYGFQNLQTQINDL